MNFSLRNVFGNKPRPAATRRRRPGLRPGLDALEGRQLLSLGTGSWQVSVTDGGTKGGSASANAPDGRVAIAYVDSVNGYSEVVVRTFGTAKQALGGEIRVDYAFQENSVDDSVRVAINNNGNFAVTWRNYNFQTHRSSVYVEQFGPSGNPIALNQVGETPRSYSTYTPDVAIDQAGNVTVSYVENFAPAALQAVEFETFNAAGNRGGYGYVNNSAGFTFLDTKLAMSPDGSFYLGYDYTGPGYNGQWDLDLARFTAGGASKVFNFPIDHQQGGPIDFALSANASDHVEVAEVAQNFTNVTSQLRITQFDTAGVAPAWTVVDNSGSSLSNPAVALANNGACVVAYNTTAVIGSHGSRGTDIVEVGSTGSVASRQALLDGYGREVSDPALSIDANGNYLATFTAPGGEIWDRGGLL
jgi:hypothetical protein